MKAFFERKFGKILGPLWRVNYDLTYFVSNIRHRHRCRLHHVAQIQLDNEIVLGAFGYSEFYGLGWLSWEFRSRDSVDSVNLKTTIKQYIMLI